MGTTCKRHAETQAPQGRQLMFTQWVTKGAILNIPPKELLIQVLPRPLMSKKINFCCTKNTNKERNVSLLIREILSAEIFKSTTSTPCPVVPACGFVFQILFICASASTLPQTWISILVIFPLVIPQMTFVAKLIITAVA